MGRMVPKCTREPRVEQCGEEDLWVTVQEVVGAGERVGLGASVGH